RVEQEVQLEVPAVPLSTKPLAHRDGPLARDAALLLREELRRYVVAAPPAVVWRELREAGELGHQRTDQRAVARDHTFDRELARLDPLHHLDVVIDDLPRVRTPFALGRDEERRLTRVAVRGLHDQVVAKTRVRGELEQRLVVRPTAHRVG